MDSFKKALIIIKTINEGGYVAYFAGGWVRDYLLKHPSDDIDIATNAPPQIIQALFEKTIPVGINFGIVVVRIENHSFEVATFRRDVEYRDGRRPTHIEFTDAIEDAKRRDFTINGMFYDPLKNELFDFVEGKKDLENKIIRAIGDPHERIFEDRLRMIRAIRYATRFNFTIEERTKEAILAHANELFPAVAIERVYQELNKMHVFNKLKISLLMLYKYNLLQAIFPQLKDVSYEEIEKRLLPLTLFPKEAPLITALLLLLKTDSEQKVIDLCQHLKLSKHDLHCATFIIRTKNFFKKPLSDAEFALIYSDPFAPLAIQILSCEMDHKESFLKEHHDRISHLQKHIDRIQQKNPVLKAEHLQQEGIKPSLKMGKLLKEGEAISINQDLDSPQKIIAILKKSSLWES